jgi:hypothetical protein
MTTKEKVGTAIPKATQRLVGKEARARGKKITLETLLMTPRRRVKPEEKVVRAEAKTKIRMRIDSLIV